MVTPSAALTTSCPCCTRWRFFERGVYCKKFENSKLAFSYSRLLSLFVYRRKEPGITKLVFCIFSFLTGTVLRKNVTLFHFENLCLIFTWKLNIWIFVWSWVSETKFSNVLSYKKKLWLSSIMQWKFKRIFSSKTESIFFHVLRFFNSWQPGGRLLLLKTVISKICPNNLACRLLFLVF